ncbi:MAG TPA: helix-turn-helix domain-containing protein [Bacteroidales bacterium]
MSEECAKNRRAVQDTLEVINGKWKLPILITLLEEPSRFKELARKVGITSRMLSKELQDLEMNKLVSRTVLETRPVSVEYAITPYGRTLQKVLEAMAEWGKVHRKTIAE